jgi:methylmalonyl-CoA carboxyltransferase small subunit
VKLRIEIDAKAYDVEVEITEEDFAAAAAPPRPSRASASSPPRPSSPPKTDVATGPSRPSAAPTPGAHGCQSPIAGVVVRVLAQEGQQVAQGEPLLVLEAMKMESSIAAPTAGTVARVLVGPGDAVKTGQLLVELT